MLRGQHRDGRLRKFRAATALASFRFLRLAPHRIFETIGKNLAAIKLCKMLGMRQEACLPINTGAGKWWDTVVLAILQDLNGKGIAMESERLKLTPIIKYSERNVWGD